MFKLLGSTWGAIVALRSATYRRGWRHVARLPRPTVSVGGLSVGGVGKTPSVAAIAELVEALGLRPAILSRGYRRQGRQPLLVSGGDGRILADAQNAGDEPFWLARTLPRAMVAVASRREQAAELALSAGVVDVFVLDDAYQHLRVARDANFLVVDASNAFWRDCPMPSGSLRENPSAATRADAFLLVIGAKSDVMSSLRARYPDVPVFELEARHPAVCSLQQYTAGVTREGRVDSGANSLPTGPPGNLPQPLFAFAGIARPHRFFEDLTRARLAVAGSHSFADHHAYRPDDLRKLERQAQAAGAKALITTEKDAVRISADQQGMDTYVWRYQLGLRRPEVLGKWLLGRLRAADRRAV
jgi:tetraacyldisaccharide 4'-kinase